MKNIKLPNILTRHLKLFLKLLFAFIVFFFLFYHSQIRLGLLVSLFHKPLLFSSTILIFLLTVLLSAHRWHLLNSAQEINLGFIRTIVPTYLGVAFNNLLPGAIGGDLIRSYYLFKKAPNKKSTALISIFLDRMLGFLGLIVVICLVIFTHLNQLHEQRNLFYLLSLFVFFCMSVLILFSVFMILPQRLGLINWLKNRYQHNRLVKSVISLLEAMRTYRLPKIIMLQCLLISVIIQILAAFTIIIIANIMGLPFVPLADYIIAFSITQVVNLIPATPGGIGIGEMAFANILLLLNPDITAAFATVYLAFRLISMLTYTPGLILYIPRYITLKRNNNFQQSTV